MLVDKIPRLRRRRRKRKKKKKNIVGSNKSVGRKHVREDITDEDLKVDDGSEKVEIPKRIEVKRLKRMDWLLFGKIKVEFVNECKELNQDELSKFNDLLNGWRYRYHRQAAMAQSACGTISNDAVVVIETMLQDKTL